MGNDANQGDLIDRLACELKADRHDMVAHHFNGFTIYEAKNPKPLKHIDEHSLYHWAAV